MEKIVNDAGELMGYRCPLELLPDFVDQGPLGSCAAVATSLCISCTIALNRGEKNRVLVPSIQEPINTVQFQFPRSCRSSTATPPTAEPDEPPTDEPEPEPEPRFYLAFGGNMPEDVYDPTDLNEGGFLDTKLEVVFRYIQYFGVGLESHQPYVGYMNNTKIPASSSRIWLGDYTVVAPRILKPDGRGFKYIDLKDPHFDIRTILQQQPVVGVLRIDPSFYSLKTGIYDGFGDEVKAEHVESHAILIYGYYTEEGQNICNVFNSHHDWGDDGRGEIYMDLFYKFVFPDPHGIWLEVRQEEEEEEEAAAAEEAAEGQPGEAEGEGADGGEGGADGGEEGDDSLHI